MTLFKRIIGLVLIVIILILLYPEQKKPDAEREKMIYDQNLSEIFDGEHNYVDYKFGKFSILEIYDNEKNKAALYLHGRGQSPNNYDLAHPVRTQLSEGFNTYSIQLPVLKKGSTYNDYINVFYDSDQRIRSALDYILNNNSKIIIVAHSCGVHMLMSFIENLGLPSEVVSIIQIGSGAVDKGQKIIAEYPYDKVNVPILDLYGQYDFDLVLKESSKREKLIKKISDKSSQFKVNGSNHYHNGNADEVIQIVKKWLSDK